MAIRRSARQTHKLRDRASNEQAELLCCLLVQSRFPHASKSLCSQLGSSIYIRGTSLQYIQMHNEKLAHQRDNPDGSKNDATFEDKAGNGAQGLEMGHLTPDSTSAGWQTITTPDTLPSVLSPSAVIRFNNTRRKPSGSITSKGSMVQNGQGDPFYYPPKPWREDDKRYLSCTMCADPLEKLTLTEDAWKYV